MSKMHLFIINENAGKKNSAKNIHDQLSLMGTHDNIKVVETKNVEQTQELIRKYSKETSGNLRIYSCGGDGTLNAIVSEAYKFSNCEIAVMPTGSGNDYIRTFEQFNKEDFLNVEKMMTGNTIECDILRVNDRISVNTTTFGYDCAVAHEMNRFRFIGGSAAYNISLIYCLISKMKHKYKLVIDDGKEIENGDENPFLLTVAGIGKYYGGGYKALPASMVNDGLIDLVFVHTISRIKFLSLVGDYKKGSHLDNLRFPMINFRRCKKLQIFSHELINTNIDGEIIPMTNPKIEIIPKAIKVVLPTNTIPKEYLPKKLETV